MGERFRLKPQTLHDISRKAGATLSVERECLGKAHRKFFVERLAQQLPGAVQTRLDRLGLDVEQLGRFFDIEPLNVARDENCAKGGRQTVDRLFKKLSHLCLHGGALRIHDLRIERKGDDLRLVGCCLQFGQLDIFLAAAQAAQGLIHGDAGEPRAEAGFSLKGIQMHKGAEVGLLYHILRLGIIAHDAAGDAKQPPVIFLDEQAESVRLARRARASKSASLCG